MPAAASLLERIQAHFPELTRAERSVAAYLRANARGIPFETAASIARKVGVSPMTVGRLLRALGYAGLGEVKEELSRSLAAAPWHVGDRYERFRRGKADPRGLADSLDREMKALIGVYELAAAPRFRVAARRIASASVVHVAGFQTVRGAAMDFASRLEYVRDGVRLLDGQNGTYAELFASRQARSCLVVIDIRRYSRQARLLARTAAERGIPMVIVTDSFCHWAAAHTDEALHVLTDVGLFWDSNAAISSLLNLLLEEVIRLLGRDVGKRMAVLETLQDRFEAFQD